MAPGLCDFVPEPSSFKVNTFLPDPFEFFQGGRVNNMVDWACRTQQISGLFQAYELGALPPRPDVVTGSFANGVLTVNATHAGNSISFQVPITPAVNVTRPAPAIIAIGGYSVPVPSDVAIINFNNDQIALQNDQTSRGVGQFFELYGVNASAGALMAWTWAIGRIIDVLEMTEGHGIDVQKLGVTGCSRNGKGAYVAGAFEPRIALTIVQESGSGGAGSWRISDYMYYDQNITTQTAMEIVQENVWFSPNFNQFVFNVTLLPFDHHMLAALVAPRGLLVIDNTGIAWLGPESVWGAQTTGRMIYEALGVSSSMGVAQEGNHNHCALPADEAPYVTAFIDRFLKDQPANTTVMTTDGAVGPDDGAPGSDPIIPNSGFVESLWVDWSIPRLA
jgi:hypothetical protein